MKLKHVALVAAACAATPSFALTPSDIDGTTVHLWITSSTPAAELVYKTIRILCRDEYGFSGGGPDRLPDDLHVYTGETDPNPGKSDAGRYFAYACTMGLGAGSLDGVKTVVYHTVELNSFDTYAPHLFMAGESYPLNGNTHARIKEPNGGTCATTAVTNVTGDATFVNCGVETVMTSANLDQFSPPTLPQGGFADTEYILSQLNLGISKSLSEIGYEGYSYVGQAYGLAVSFPLYAELQKAQGIVASTAHNGEACDGNYTAGACQPNINRQKYTSLVSAGSVTNKDGSLFGAAPGSIIKVARLQGTSGTQMASNIFFLNRPCAMGSPGGAGSLAGSDSQGTTSYNGGKVQVTTYNSDQNAKSALSAASYNNELAIGVLPLTTVPFFVYDKFAFVRLNGVSPNVDYMQRQTAINGDYEFWYGGSVSFIALDSFSEGNDLIVAISGFLLDAGLDSSGMFYTPDSGYPSSYLVNVSKGARHGNSCSQASQ